MRRVQRLSCVVQHRLVRSVMAAVCAAFQSVAQASDQCNVASFVPAAHRFLEDCHALGELQADAPERQGLQALRYVPISDYADSFVTLGGELRIRRERFDAQRFGLMGGPAFSANEGRLNVHADVHMRSFRVFTQLNVATQSGWPVARPADQSAMDLAQAFVQWGLNADQISNASFVRFGRQEIALSPNRLIGVNEATNLRRTFDGALAQVTSNGMIATAFLTRPVANKPGAFDDHSDTTQKFNGLNLHATPATSWGLQSLDGFLFRRERANAVFQNAHGSEIRDTYGIRAGGSIAPLEVLLQVDWQRGHVGPKAIAAHAATLDLTWRMADVVWSPQLAFSAGWAEGDRHPSAATIRTFDTLYPNLAYGTDAGYFFPGNSQDASISVTVKPTVPLSVQFGIFGYWRLSRSDAIYQPPGFVLLPGNGSGSNHIATLPFIKAAYQLDRYSELSLSLVRLSAGPALVDAGGKSANYGLMQWQFRF